MLNNYSTFQNQYTYLVDCAGNVLCSNKTNIYDWGDVVTKGMEKGVRRYEFNWDNKDYFACRQYNGLTGWETYSVVSTDDFFPQAKETSRSNYGPCFASNAGGRSWNFYLVLYIYKTNRED